MNSIYYPTSDFKFKSIDSIITSNSIFSGEILDYFSVFSYIIKPKKVLVLGGGIGELQRKLFLNNEQVNADIIEISQDKIDIQRAINNIFFPKLNPCLNYLKGNAEYFDELVNGNKYDLICIDIYDENGYPFFLIKDEFWFNISKALNDGGVVLFNSLGYPEHIESRWSPHLFFNEKFNRMYKKVYFTKVRRGCVFILGNKNITLSFDSDCKQYKKLNSMDRLFMEYMELRVRSLTRVNNTKSFVLEDIQPFTKQFMNKEMERIWPSMMESYQKYVPIEGEDIWEYTKKITEKIISGESNFLNIITFLIQENNIHHALLPNMIGSLDSAKYDFNWYFEWICNKFDSIFESNFSILIEIYIPQLFTLMFREPNKYKEKMDKLESLINILKQRGFS